MQEFKKVMQLVDQISLLYNEVEMHRQNVKAHDQRIAYEVDKRQKVAILLEQMFANFDLASNPQLTQVLLIAIEDLRA